jgi:hypothetical protein
LELPIEVQGVTVSRVPAFQAIRVRGGEETAAASRAALALRQRRRVEGAIDGMLAHPQLLGKGPPRPPLLGQGPDLLMERRPLPLPLVGHLPGRARKGWGWHRPGRRAGGPRHRRRAAGRIDGRAGLALRIQDRIESCGEVLQQVNAIGALARLGGTLPGPVRVCAGPIPGDHADAGMGLSPAGDGLGLTSGPESERSPPVEVDPHGPRGRALAIGPILHAEPVGGQRPAGADDAAGAGACGD